MMIHLHSKQGLYTVTKYNKDFIYLKTKHSKFQAPTSDFKSLAGGPWNRDLKADELRSFLEVVAPDLLANIDRQEALLVARLNVLAEESEDEDDVPILDEPSAEQYAKWWREGNIEKDNLRKKLMTVGHKVYADLASLSILHTLQIDKGLKFIIQVTEDDQHRFCFDPYEIGSNYHSDLSEMYRTDGYYTINGGWLKIIDNKVTLYAQSGDYGVYNDDVALAAAKLIFPNKEIVSYAGKQWDDINPSDMDILPF